MTDKQLPEDIEKWVQKKCDEIYNNDTHWWSKDMKEIATAMYWHLQEEFEKERVSWKRLKNYIHKILASNAERIVKFYEDEDKLKVRISELEKQIELYNEIAANSFDTKIFRQP